MNARAWWTADPRPDLPGGELWVVLLATTFDLDGRDPDGVFGVLRGLRCLGCRLDVRGGAVVLLPPSGETRATLTTWIADHAGAVRAALAEVGRTVGRVAA